MRLVGTLPDGTEKEIKFRDCGELKRQDRNGEKCYVTEFIVDGLIKDSVLSVKDCHASKAGAQEARTASDIATLRAFGFVKAETFAGLFSDQPDFILFDDREKTVSDAAAQMPRYKCHKEVHALKISAIEILEDGAAKIAAVGYALTVITKPGVKFPFKGGEDPGYYVVYADGYESWSPTKAFEEGYTRV